VDPGGAGGPPGIRGIPGIRGGIPDMPGGGIGGIIPMGGIIPAIIAAGGGNIPGGGIIPIMFGTLGAVFSDFSAALIV